MEFCQLADSLPIEKVKVPCLGQLKYNGTRCIAFINEGKVTFKTRNQKEFTYPRLAEQLQNIKGKAVFDGELCFGDSQHSDHTKVSGIVNSSIHGNPIGSAHNLSYNVFDCIPFEEFHKQSCDLTYKDRFRMVQHTFINTGPFIKIAKTWEFESIKEVQDTYADLLEQGYEGLILKYWHHKYEWKRSKQWIKMKAIETADLKCVGIYGGEGKYTGMIGGLLCEGVVDDKFIKVRVGSGLNDFQRGLTEDDFYGSTIEVLYNTVIQDKKTSEWSLFLPRFKSVRIDK